MRFPKLFMRERMVTVQQFRDEDRNPHIYVITNKRIAELNYKTQKPNGIVITMHDIKKAKKAPNKLTGEL